MRTRIAAVIAGLAMTLAACGTTIDAPGMERAFTNAAGGPVSSMCDSSSPTWSCYYDGVEAGSGYLVVKLTTDAGANTDALADRAGIAWFNFIHCQYPDLDTIVVRVNGVDHNVFRSDTNADLLAC